MPANDPKYQSKYIRKHYSENKEYYKKKAAESRLRARIWFEELKLERSCIECNEDDPSCLDFHHRDEETKSFELAGAWKRYGKQKILDEVKKCDVLCANCHRKHTAHQQNWYRRKDSNSRPLA